MRSFFTANILGSARLFIDGTTKCESQGILSAISSRDVQLQLSPPLPHALIYSRLLYYDRPYYHVSLDGIGLAVTWFGAVAAILIGAGLLTSSLPVCLTALAVYTLFGGLYEAAHYLAHTRCPLPPLLNRMRRHHNMHHTVSDRHWLAFTVPAVDNLFNTNPNPKDVARVRGGWPSLHVLASAK